MPNQSSKLPGRLSQLEDDQPGYNRQLMGYARINGPAPHKFGFGKRRDCFGTHCPRCQCWIRASRRTDLRPAQRRRAEQLRANDDCRAARNRRWKLRYCQVSDRGNRMVCFGPEQSDLWIRSARSTMPTSSGRCLCRSGAVPPLSQRQFAACASGGSEEVCPLAGPAFAANGPGLRAHRFYSRQSVRACVVAACPGPTHSIVHGHYDVLPGEPYANGIRRP